MIISKSTILNRIEKSSGGISYVSSIMQQASILRKGGMKIIDCGLGEPSHGLRKDVIKVGKKALEGNYYDYVKPLIGLSELREKIANRMGTEFGNKITSDNVIVTSGSEVALDVIMRTLIDIGDEVIIFDPFFIPFSYLVSAYGGKPIFVDTYKDSFLPDIEKTKKAISHKTKMMIINSPHNPTGRVYPKNIIRMLSEIAEKRNIIILSDEAYRDFDYDSMFVSPYEYSKENSIILRTFSKTYSMMGYKVGYILSHNKLIKPLAQFIQIPAWSAPRISSMMATQALNRKLQKKDLKRYKKVRDLLYPRFQKMNLVNYMPEGAFYFYLKSPNDNAYNFSKILLNNGVLTTPGFSQQNTHVRLSYGKLNLEQIDFLIDKISCSL